MFNIFSNERNSDTWIIHSFLLLYFKVIISNISGTCYVHDMLGEWQRSDLKMLENTSLAYCAGNAIFHECSQNMQKCMKMFAWKGLNVRKYASFVKICNISWEWAKYAKNAWTILVTNKKQTQLEIARLLIRHFTVSTRHTLTWYLSNNIYWVFLKNFPNILATKTYNLMSKTNGYHMNTRIWFI